MPKNNHQNLFSAFIFLIFGTGDEQTWNSSEKESSKGSVIIDC